MPRTSAFDTLFRSIADAYNAGNTAYVASQFTYPLPIFLGDALYIYGTFEQMDDALRCYRYRLLSEKIVRLEPVVVATGLEKKHMSSVWVDWKHLDRAGTCRRLSKMRFATLTKPGAALPVLEMVEYKMAEFPGLEPAIADSLVSKS